MVVGTHVLAASDLVVEATIFVLMTLPVQTPVRRPVPFAVSFAAKPVVYVVRGNFVRQGTVLPILHVSVLALRANVTLQTAVVMLVSVVWMKAVIFRMYV